MASKIGRVIGHKFTYSEDDAAVVKTTLYFSDGTKVDVDGHVLLATGASIELTGTGTSPFTLTGVATVLNGH